MLPLALICALLLAACGEDEGAATPEAGSETTTEAAQSGNSGQRFPELLEAEATETEPRTYDIAVTISSPYDSPDRYASGWRVLTANGELIAEHELLHDHASEQPFTRVQTGVEVDATADTVVIEGRDLANGYGGRKLELSLPG
jgi:hypothetical protein